MEKFVYIVRFGTLSKVTNEFILTNYYRSSLKKAKALKEEILKENKAENIVNSFEGYDNLQKQYIEAVDYFGENNKYKARIIIDKERVY